MRGKLIGSLALLLMLAAPAGSGALVQMSQEERAEALFAEGEGLMRLGRLDAARETFEGLIADYPRRGFSQLVWRAAARVRLADLRWRGGAPDLAAAEYVEVLEEEPPSEWTSRARLGLAGVALMYGDWVAAADLLRRVVVDAQRGAPDGDATAAEEARRRLTLLHRFKIRLPAGEAPWDSTASVPVSGIELDDPVSLAAGPDGQLLIVDEGIPAVVLVDAARSTASRLPFDDHTRPWWGIDGLPYLPTRRVGVVALGGSRVGFLASEDGRAVPLKELEAGARTPAGRWYLLDDDPARVLRFGSEGDFQGVVTGERQEPVDVAVDRLGRLYVLDRETRSVVRFDEEGRREGPVVSASWEQPQAIELDALGNLYVLDRGRKTIDVHDSDGGRLHRLGPVLPGGVEMRDPRDLAVDGSGQVYVADRRQSVVLVIR